MGGRGRSFVPCSCKKNILTCSSFHGTISAHAAAIPARIGATVGVEVMFENSRSVAVYTRQRWQLATRRCGAQGGEEGSNGEARGHGGSLGGCRWPRRRGTVAAVTAIPRSDRAARLKTGPDRHFFGPNIAARTDQFSYRSWTVRSGPERATSGHNLGWVRPGLVLGIHFNS